MRYNHDTLSVPTKGNDGVSTISAIRRCLLVAAIALASSTAAFAGPPYLTDDPEPVPYHHWEFYTFATGDRTRDTKNATGPAIEVNNGVAPNLQLHLVVPSVYTSSGGVSASGIGDVEAGAKYRFLSETRNRPEIGLFPLAELPSGNHDKGLGNGRAWFKLPVWLQKSWGPWTTYGGGGYAFNSAPGQRNYAFGGELIQRTISPKLTLGGEVFFQGASVDSAGPGEPYATGSRSFAVYNLGGQYNFTPDLSLLFTAGHSFQGEGNTLYYVGLYRTWGPGAP